MSHIIKTVIIFNAKKTGNSPVDLKDTSPIWKVQHNLSFLQRTKHAKHANLSDLKALIYLTDELFLVFSSTSKW